MGKVQAPNNNVFSSPGAVFSPKTGRVVVAWGPFEARSHRIPDRLALYAPDFFLDDPTPWYHPVRWADMDVKEFLSLLSRSSVENISISWKEVVPNGFHHAFADIKGRIQAGSMHKAVAVAFEEGGYTQGHFQLVRSVLARSHELSPHEYLYGLWDGSSGIIGASPEILFSRRSPREVETMALAGTAPRGKGKYLFQGEKEKHEHRFVIDDLRERLSRVGDVTIEETKTLSLSTLEHLWTPIRCTLHEPLDFESVVRLLHPTAALGTFPRKFSDPWLRMHTSPEKRRRFGAPFGMEWPDGHATCLVGIRNLQWQGDAITIASGCGIVAESELEREWNELRLKREAVKSTWGLA